MRNQSFSAKNRIEMNKKNKKFHTFADVFALIKQFDYERN